MSKITKSIELDVPVRMAYDQWTQFEHFPRFMEGVEEVRQLDAKSLRWRAKVGGRVVEWDAEIYEQIPDDRIAWRSRSGARNEGVVRFESLSPDRTRISLDLVVAPQGFTEKLGDVMGAVSSRVEGDLRRFKEFIESRSVETGAWRGEIHESVVTPPPPTV